MKLDAPAKINLGLHVLRLRSDGYHDIETVMVRIDWHDTLEAEPAEVLSLSCSDLSLPVNEDNLCIKAAAALASRFGVQDGARLHLTKRIPVGAGLGGGSSDAASTLRLLSDLWGLPVTTGELADLAASIGADVPFFLGPSPSLAEGRGERITVVPSVDGGPLQIPFVFVVAKPKRSVSTAEAYGWVGSSDRDRRDLADIVRSCDLDLWRRELTNDFEPVVGARVPEIQAIKTAMYDEGAGFAAMSGSGTAVFGVFHDPESADNARKVLEDGNTACWSGNAV